MKRIDSMLPRTPSAGPPAVARAPATALAAALLPLLLLLSIPTGAWAEGARDRAGAGTGGDHVAGPLVRIKTDSGFEFFVDGYMRTRASFIFEEAGQTDFVGRNDGFGLANARLANHGRYGDLHFELEFDGAVDRRDTRNAARGKVQMEMKDAYIAYEPFSWLHFTVGQFKPPFDGEEQVSSRDLLFINRSVVSRGIKGVEGINVDGLSRDREVGFMVSSAPLMLDSVPIGFAYFLSVANGVGPNKALNDNDKLAVFGRIELYWDTKVTLGVGAYLDEASTGQPPDLLGERQIGLAADAQIDIFNVLVAAQYTQRTTSFPDIPGEPERVARGFAASIGYRAPFGIVPAYRFASYDPTATFQAEDPVLAAQLQVDEVKQHTFGVTWLVPWIPLKVAVNYTLMLEDKARKIDNDRLDALVQVAF